MLSSGDFLRLSGALFFLLLEWIFRSLARLIWAVLPQPLLQRLNAVIQKASDLAFREIDPYDHLRDCDAAHLIRYHEYDLEEHTIETPDGYLITMHRVIPPRPETNGSTKSANTKHRPPVLIMHGFLECSEVWLPLGKGRALPYLLVDAGYDVWLGNVRGNRYGCKHIRLDSRMHEFWKFGMDEMVRYDIPAMIRRILAVSAAEKIFYVAFSQGTGLGFALFSTNHELASKVHMFFALAPAARVHGVKLSLVDTLMRCDPNIIYLMFGRRRLLGMTNFWRAILPSKTFVRLLDECTNQLFGWKMKNIVEEEKPMLYAHLYSLGSVRTMVHWFQTIASSRFQMYDDNISRNRKYPSHIPPEYPIRQMRVPTVLFYGGSDTLSDIPWLLKQLENTLVRSFCVTEYEHLDFQFSSSAPDKVYRPIISMMRTVAELRDVTGSSFDHTCCSRGTSISAGICRRTELAHCLWHGRDLSCFLWTPYRCLVYGHLVMRCKRLKKRSDELGSIIYNRGCGNQKGVVHIELQESPADSLRQCKEAGRSSVLMGVRHLASGEDQPHIGNNNSGPALRRRNNNSEPALRRRNNNYYYPGTRHPRRKKGKIN